MERLESQAQSGNKDSKKHKTPPRWITDSMWRQCQHLDATMPPFNRLCRSIMSNYKQWKLFETCEQPYELMKHPYDSSLVTLGECRNFICENFRLLQFIKERISLDLCNGNKQEN